MLKGHKQDEMTYSDLQSRQGIIQMRKVAHQAFFFLGMLHLTRKKKDVNSDIREYAKFAVLKIHMLIKSVMFPPGNDTKGEQPKTIVATKALLDHIDEWQSKFDTYDSETLPNDYVMDEVSYLRKNLQQIIDNSLPINPFIDSLLTFPSIHFFQYYIHEINVSLHKYDIYGYLRKHLTTILVFLLALFLLFKVEIIYSLLVDEKLWVGGCLIFLLIPIVFHFQQVLGFNEDGNISRWDIGGSPFRSLKYTAIGPDPSIDRWGFTNQWQSKLQPSNVAASNSKSDVIDNMRGMIINLAHKFMPESAAKLLDHIVFALLLKLAAYLIWVTIGGFLFGYLFWGGYNAAAPVMTIYIMLGLVAILVVLGILIDHWDFLDARPIRVYLLMFFGVITACVLYGFQDYLFIPFLLTACLVLFYFFKESNKLFSYVLVTLLVSASIYNGIKIFQNRFSIWSMNNIAEHGDIGIVNEAMALKRVTNWPLGGNTGDPVVIMAASGGGSRAALFTALLLEKLHPKMTTEKGLPTKHDVNEYLQISNNLQAISSVSGGSLATAGYLARRLWELGDGENHIGSLPKAVQQDFILPMLTGIARIGVTRGQNLEEVWDGYIDLEDEVDPTRAYCLKYENVLVDRSRVGLGNICLSDIAEKWVAHQNNETAPLPLPLFNTATLDAHDLVISPLEKALYTDSTIKEVDQQPSCNWFSRLIQQCDKLTWTFSRDGIYSLDDLLGSYNPKLSAAVRASANFPFGFPLVEIATTKILAFSPLESDHIDDSKKIVYLTDGGVISNSGLIPLVNLLKNTAQALKQRGVLMIIVNASKMPEYTKPGPGADLISTIGNQDANGQRMHRSMINELSSIYCDRLAVWQIDLTPTTSNNLLTTWSLSESYADKLKMDFEKRWKAEKETLKKYWKHLKSVDKTTCSGNKAMLSTRRLPVD